LNWLLAFCYNKNSLYPPAKGLKCPAKTRGKYLAAAIIWIAAVRDIFSMIRVMKGIREGEVYMKYSFESVKYEKNLPAKILMQDKPGYRCNTKQHWHKELEIVYMIHGTMHVKIGRKEQTINDGEFYFVNSEDIHVTSVPDKDTIYQYFVILLSYEFMRNYCRKIDSIAFEVENNEQAKKEIKENVLRIIDLDQSRGEDDYTDLEINARLLDIYHTLLCECAVHKQNRYPQNVQENFIYAKKAIEYMGQNYKEEITLNDIAALVGLTPSYFSKYFKNITESSFTQYLNGVRLEYALKDMIYNHDTVTNAALENGFANVKSFINLCKKVYGCTPNQYKKQFGDNWL